MNDKISIVVPVFNTESHLTKCLTSILSQTHSNIEVLLINDGSTDKSGTICDEFANNDSRVKVFHKENGGVSSAKNIGLNHSTGDYVGFVDSDDWIASDMYEVLLSALKFSKADISVARYYKTNEDDDELSEVVNMHQINNPVSTKDMVLYPLMRDFYLGFCGYMCNKLFSARLFEQGKMCFREDIRYGEDVLLYTQIVLSNNCTGVYVDKPLYYYLQRNTAASKSRSVEFRKNILKVYKCVEQLLDENGYGEDSFWARGFYCYHVSVIAEIALETGVIDVFQEMQKQINAHFDDYRKTNLHFPNKLERMRKILEQ